jgi:hypothetical protein
MDRHRYDASLDQDPSFHLDADPDPDSEITPNFSHVGKAVQFYIVLPVSLCYLPIQRHRCDNFQ